MCKAARWYTAADYAAEAEGVTTGNYFSVLQDIPASETGMDAEPGPSDEDDSIDIDEMIVLQPNQISDDASDKTSSRRGSRSSRRGSRSSEATLSCSDDGGREIDPAYYPDLRSNFAGQYLKKPPPDSNGPGGGGGNGNPGGRGGNPPTAGWTFDPTGIEFVKTCTTVPMFIQRVRGYACGVLLPDGAVGHDDASNENGYGATELHPTVLEQFGFTRRSVYYVKAGVYTNPLEPTLLTNGQYNPEWLTSIVFGSTSFCLYFAGCYDGCDFFTLGPPTIKVPKRRCDPLETLDEVCESALGYLREHGFIDEVKAKVYHAQQPLPQANLSSFEGGERAEWGLVSKYVRDDLRPAYHSLHVRNADKKTVTGQQALDNLQLLNHTLEKKHGTKGYKVVKPNALKVCASCCNDPPPKYKWKYRVCDQCWKTVNSCGAITPMGHDIRRNQTVADGAPGKVHLYSSTLPPKRKKWNQVEIPTGAITMRVSDAPWMNGVKAMEKVLKITASDIFKIDTSLEKQKQEAVLGGIAISGCYPMVTRKGLYSRMQALIGRAFLRKPKSDPVAWAKLEEMKHLILPAGALDGPRMSVEDWIASMPGARKRALKRAWKQFLEDGSLQEKDLTFSAFVKQELLAAFEEFDGSVSKELEESIARMIMAPQEKAHIVVGPVIKPKLMRLKENWNHENWLFYGATTPKKLQKWLDDSVGACLDGEVFVFWCDFSMFDCTHSANSMKLIESYYQEMLTDPLFKQVIDAWRYPGGNMGELKFKLQQIMLASGRDDTALMNAMYCGFVIGMAVAAAIKNKPLEELDEEDLRFAMAYVRVSICGDDTLGFLPKAMWPRRVQIMASIEANLTRFGLVSKLDCSNYLGSAVYLGMRPYNVPTPLGRQWLWGRTIGRAAYKLGWMLDPTKGDAAAWATGVAESIVLTQPYVPLLSDLARKTVELRIGCRRTPVLADPNKPWTNWTPRFRA